MITLNKIKTWLGITFLTTFHLVILNSIQFTVWPEVLSFPYMIDRGFLIYRDFHHVYQPLLTFLLTGFYQMFGFSVITLKVFTWILIVSIDIFVFLIINKITKNKKYAFLGLVAFVLIQPLFEGNMLWFDLAVTLPLLSSIYFLVTYFKDYRLDRNLFLSGIFLGISFLVKQQAILVAFPILIYLFLIKTPLKKYVYFLCGLLFAVLPVILFLLLNGLFLDYFFWTFTFPISHLPKIEGYTIYPNYSEMKILLLLFITLTTGLLTNFKKLKKEFYLLLSVLFFLFLSAFPRFSLFHLQPFLALYVVIIMVLLSNSSKWFLIFLLPLFMLWKFQIATLNKEDRFYTTKDIDFAKKIEEVSNSKKIYLLGPNSLTYVLSDTIPPKPWIENYVWHFEIPGIQEKVIAGWEQDPPEFIFWSTPQVGKYYELGVYQPKLITEYIIRNYDRISEVDLGVWEWRIKEK